MRKLNGYRVTHRNKWLLIKHGVLSVQELSLLEFYADIFDFDKDHEAFGSLNVDFSEIAKVFNCKSENTVRNWHNKLLRLGFISKVQKRNVYMLSCFLRYISPGHWGGKASDYAKSEANQSFGIILQNLGLSSQTIEDILQTNEKLDSKLALNSTSKALSSSKDEYKVSQDNVTKSVQNVRSDEEYQEIYKENNYEGLTPEDMKWIDENIK